MAVLERTENRTISGFILPQSEALTSLNDLTVAIQKERLAWQSSGAAENFALLWGELYEKYPKFKNPLPHELVVKNKKTTLYADQTQVKGNVDGVYNKLRSQMSAGLKADVDQLVELETEHTTHYRESVKPFVQERDEVTESLIVNWLDFMTETPGNFHDFSIFMETDENLGGRENIRPFLQALENYRAGQQTKGKDAIESTEAYSR